MWICNRATPNNSACDAIAKSGSTHLAPLSSNIPFYRYRCQHPPVTTAGAGRQVPVDAAARQSPGTAAATTRRAPTDNYRPIDTCKAQPYFVVPIWNFAPNCVCGLIIINGSYNCLRSGKFYNFLSTLMLGIWVMFWYQKVLNS